MSLAIKYENADDANMRLRYTVVLYKGEPVQIQQVVRGEGKGDDILRVLFTPLPLGKDEGKLPIVPAPKRRVRNLDDLVALDVENDAEMKRKYISSKHFDIAPFKLGYVNRPSGSGVFYCTRLPNRIQKQGLCGENFSARDNYGAPINFNTFLSCKQMIDMVHGNYPSFDEALRLLAEKVNSVAFHRDFALVKDEVIPNLLFLYHKGNKVGMYARNSGEVSLGNKYACLKESLQEQRIKVGVC